MPDVHVHIRTRAQSRYSYSSSSQMYSASRDRYSFYSNTNENITEKNENEPTTEENNGKEDEGESTEEEELYHPSLGVYSMGRWVDRLIFAIYMIRCLRRLLLHQLLPYLLLSHQNQRRTPTNPIPHLMKRIDPNHPNSPPQRLTLPSGLRKPSL